MFIDSGGCPITFNENTITLIFLIGIVDLWFFLKYPLRNNVKSQIEVELDKYMINQVSVLLPHSYVKQYIENFDKITEISKEEHCGYLNRILHTDEGDSE